jgi:hypothetical protein
MRLTPLGKGNTPTWALTLVFWRLFWAKAALLINAAAKTKTVDFMAFTPRRYSLTVVTTNF